MEVKVNNPEHYHPGTYEAIKVIEAWGLGFCLGNVVKYISRAGRKTGSDELEDLKKAAWYLNREIEKRENAVIGFDLKEGSGYTKNNLRDGITIETSGTTMDSSAVNRSYTKAVKEYEALSSPKL